MSRSKLLNSNMGLTVLIVSIVVTAMYVLWPSSKPNEVVLKEVTVEVTRVVEVPVTVPPVTASITPAVRTTEVATTDFRLCVVQGGATLYENHAVNEHVIAYLDSGTVILSDFTFQTEGGNLWKEVKVPQGTTVNFPESRRATERVLRGWVDADFLTSLPCK